MITMRLNERVGIDWQIIRVSFSGRERTYHKKLKQNGNISFVLKTKSLYKKQNVKNECYKKGIFTDDTREKNAVKGFLLQAWVF